MEPDGPEDPAQRPRRAGWWTPACLALLALAPAWVFLHAFGCAVGENAAEHGRRVCERLDGDAWLPWAITGAAALPLLLVVALIAPRRLTFAVTAMLLVAQALLVAVMETVGLPPDPLPGNLG